MKTPKLIILLLLSLLACKKEDPKNPLDPTPAYIMPSTAGSYWVYQLKSVDSLGNETLEANIDSLFILGDTVINGKTYVTYAKSMGPNPQYTFRRDSSGYIIDQDGYKYLSYNHPEDTLGQAWSPGFMGPNGPITLNIVQYTLQHQYPVSTPASEFTSFVARLSTSDSAGGPMNACGDPSIESNIYYVSGVGRVRTDFWYSAEWANDCAWKYYELIDYYIAP